METQLYECTICHKNVPFQQIQYMRGSPKLACAGCSGRMESTQNASIAVSSQSRHISKEGTQERRELQCATCRYKFTMKKGTKIALRCPYCAGSNLLMTSKGINEIIETADS